MNKELHIQIVNLNIEIFELRNITGKLEELFKIEDAFKQKESILALRKIKNYYDIKKDELSTKEKRLSELRSLCNHYIAIKSNRLVKFQCLFCKEYFFDIREMEYKPGNYLWIDTSNDLDVDRKLRLFFDDTINSDKDVMEEVSRYVGEIQYESKIKIYRRQS